MIKELKADGNLNSGLGIKFISNKDNYYIKINLEYTLNSREYYTENNLITQRYRFINDIEELGDRSSNKKKEIILTNDQKFWLKNRYNEIHPQLAISDIPDKVELVEIDHTSSSVKIRFCVDTKYYWVASKDVSHLFGQIGIFNNAIPYWNNFPLSLDNLPPATKDNTVHFPRTVSLDSLSNENLITIEDESTGSIWVKVTAGNEDRRSITGWVNIKKDAQEHVKRISPWHWQGFETVIEKASVGEFYTKINDNRAGTLDIKEYTDSMKALHKILIESLLYSVQRKKGLPPFTIEFLKDGLRNSWIAEMIGHLIIKYESEWYADEALTKWNEIDDLLEEEKQKQKNLIEKQLDENNITIPYKRDHALSMVDDVHEKTKSIWQLEKEQRIKLSLWWREVAQSQATQSSNNQTPQTPALSNLSADGKAWFIHPVSVMGRFISPGIVTYHIYHDGKIEKHIPQEISKDYKQKYKYVYHDEKDNEHEICICDWHTIKKKQSDESANNLKKGSEDDTFWTHSPILSNNKVSDGNTKRRVFYENGDVAEFGSHDSKGTIWRLFRATANDTELIKIPDSLNKQFDNFKIKYSFIDSQRRYANPGLFAAMLGSIAVYNKSVTTTGSAFKWGSCFPSINHINGMSIDFTYKSYKGYKTVEINGKKIRERDYHPHTSQQYKDDEAFLNAMRLFFEKILVGKNVHFEEFRKLKGVANGGGLHDGHFHAEFSLTKIKEIEE